MIIYQFRHAKKTCLYALHMIKDLHVYTKHSTTEEIK